MPFDPGLAERLETVMTSHFADLSAITETRMFGGFGYMLNGNMCLGIHKETLIVRVGQETAEKILQEDHIRPMDLTGKVMKGWATVEADAIDEDDKLARYCSFAVDFVSTLPAKG